MRVLVTGATGFVGNHVVKVLLERGHHVIASSTGRTGALSKGWFSRVTYVPFDLNDYSETEDYFTFFQQPEAMIHLAWEGLPNYKEDFHIKINYPRDLQLLSSLVRNGLGNLTVAGTCLEYGMQEGCLHEEMPAMPVIAYPQAKDMLRKDLELLQGRYDFILKWVRLFYMYGEGQSSKSLLSQLDKAIEEGAEVFNMSGGEQVRDYLPVEKVAEYLVRIAENKSVSGIVNCCSNQPVKLKDFIEAYLENKNATIKLNPGFYPYNDYEPMAFWGDDSRLKSYIKNE